MSDDNKLVRLRRLRALAIAETLTLLGLVGVAVPLKHVAGWPVAVHVMGPVHGLVFLAYCRAVVAALAEGGWTRSEAFRLLASAFVPFAGFANLALFARKAARRIAARP
ncbi:DUF3817 domain-containing protein [Bradyrhizobium sp. U87765 SZCCT0131]|uniref:DUF3817 domain-containing protein n=1 Tax=unclassified Bradyrhizobium TaxID=2631580 RepID=UPI001BAE510A|nr:MULTISPECIES: DUF3817 domain-containing protein [unclassified Bradyrhizobium]MBR1218576.1 DUF3817 domain-containing protein [Bradyrhizobium sp. U87765 SZCCT0131]MBR1265665.1 DUF3817 domain-containing protein [Bradyrhizobium sp. U87765 SZCCT0134]MBR1304074.1 DUF3817 domain-containing protein [Bradyrhizobium sp. U87765 SZCCT0110]MBR1319680.1 DUF3817 domain-containing protein [Bradyrhizobium sp. U87765 SZCCT0109]MBR1348005.1 DUF3817 domain-containing protein [Bradyrhizobium sp. U87765 SZCCT004